MAGTEDFQKNNPPNSEKGPKNDEKIETTSFAGLHKNADQPLKSRNHWMQTHLSSVIALATLPHLSPEERKMLITEISKANQYMFDAYKLEINSRNDNSKKDKHLLVFGFLLLLVFSIFLVLAGKDSFFERFLNTVFALAGGGGFTIYFLYRKGRLHAPE